MNINRITFALAALLTILLAALSSAQLPESGSNTAKANRANREVSQQNVEQLLRLGVAADQYGDRRQALAHYQQALSLSRQINNRALEARALENKRHLRRVFRFHTFCVMKFFSHNLLIALS